MPTTPSSPKRSSILLTVAVIGSLVIAGLLGSMNRALVGGIGAHVHDILVLPLFVLGKVPITLTFLVKVILFLILLGVVANGVLHILQRRILTHTPLQLPQQFALARVASYCIFALGLVIGLESFGLNLSSLVVVGGALGLGVGLGLQTVVANFVAGLILLFEQPIRVGDRIEVGDTSGDVLDIRGRSTWVRTNDNIVIIIPNSDFITNKLTNWTVNDREVRIPIPVGVGYGSNPIQVRETLLRVAQANPDVLDDPPPSVIFKDFGDNSLDFVLRVTTTSKVQFPALLRSELYFAIFAAFAEAKIELPFPQRDLHLRSIDPEVLQALRQRNGSAPAEP
ncbi:MAG TPA: mechanosensitive ion channel domain-containing protein [Acidisoma sp.]|jgi:small-conductance mechanosensitive channel|nr:mechanosensitive ion channel domain-containing protein [Acidisoma sp.]